ncbi:MAG: SAM-dependent chlorinase/fluorinase [Proteobacteria bacterium]|nr:SAM-dependent chlorinase/fluorinase [Pseudomonadota bacterium]MBU1709145.1 SAM-dependent chlorinase/fluorinase [Pseudomonadota bacterium]
MPGEIDNNIITLTTDFGLHDEYVGIVKGIILSRRPEVSIVDLCHTINPYNILQAAYCIEAAFPFFSAGTLHVVIVDPGVGSARKIILLCAHRQFFLAPDNGVLTCILKKGVCEKAFEVTNSELFLHPISGTFHGRDIFAPVAAALASGLAPEKLGKEIPLSEPTVISLPAVFFDSHSNSLSGNIIHSDHFGNLITNIHRDDLKPHNDEQLQRASVSIGSATVCGISKYYAAKSSGEIIALIGSRGYLEIAVNQGSALKRLVTTNLEQIPVSVDFGQK